MTGSASPENASAGEHVAWAVASALAVLIGGYVPLLSFWVFGHNPAGVPGFFNYPDATWGDG
jgi:hypothetical protein